MAEPIPRQDDPSDNFPYQFKRKKSRSISRQKQQNDSMRRLTAGVPSASRADLAASMKHSANPMTPLLSNTHYSHTSTQELSSSNPSQSMLR